MPLNIPHAHATCVHRDDLFVKAGKPALIFDDQLRLKGAVPIPRNRDLQRFAIGQYRLLGIPIAVIIGIFSLRNLILLRFCQVLVHLGVQHPICQGFSELAHQSGRRKYLLRVLTLQQLVNNLALDRHTLSPSSLKYGSDTQNFRYSPVKRWSYSTLCPVCSCTKPCVLSNRTCMVLPSGPTSQRLIFTTLPPFLSDSSIVWLSIIFSDTLVNSSLPLYGASVPSSLAEKDRPIRSDISSASPVILKIVSSAWFETSPSVIRHAPEAR